MFSREGGAVPYVLPSCNGTPYVPERLSMGPLAQLGPLCGYWMSPFRRPTGALPLLRVASAVPPTPSKTINPGVSVVFHATVGDNQTAPQIMPS